MSNYYYQTRNGKRVRVRRGNKRAAKKLLQGAELLGVAGGLAGGVKVGGFLVNKVGRNGVIRQSAMAGGGLAGGAVALMLADKYLRKYE